MEIQRLLPHADRRPQTASDVQVTKDLVPVIYHDFLLSETGADVGVHAVTFEQVRSPGWASPAAWTCSPS